MERIESFGWLEKVESLQKQIEVQVRRSKSAATKSEKDGAIQRRHYLQMQLDYWRGKYERFTMTEIPEGFSNRQGVDIGIIGKYARLYLKTVLTGSIRSKDPQRQHSAKCGGCRRNTPTRSV